MKNLNFFAEIFKGFFFNVTEAPWKTLPALISTENNLVIYKIVTADSLHNFFDCLVGNWDQKVLFLTEAEVKYFCENKLPNWLKSEDITNIFLCRIDPNQKTTEKNTKVIVTDIRGGKFIIRCFPLNNDVIWGGDLEHKIFILIP